MMAADPLPVLMVLADRQDFYYKEYGDTRDSIEAAGLAVEVAATTTNPSVAHPNTGQGDGDGVAVPDLALADVDPAKYSAMLPWMSGGLPDGRVLQDAGHRSRPPFARSRNDPRCSEAISTHPGPHSTCVDAIPKGVFSRPM